MKERDVVLIVSSDAETRASIGSRLEEEGLMVMACPGPTEPDYDCVGERTGRCPLADGADVAVLDGCLASDDAGDGVSSEELLRIYLASGVPVGVLRHPGQRPTGGRRTTSRILTDVRRALEGGPASVSDGLVVDLVEPDARA